MKDKDHNRIVTLNQVKQRVVIRGLDLKFFQVSEQRLGKAQVSVW